MAGIRALKDRARLQLHKAMEIPAIYIWTTDAGTTFNLPCTVRLHTDDKALGDVRGTSFGYAERHEKISRIIFLAAGAAAIDPDNGAIVSFAPGEAYRVDNVLPRDGITITAEVTKLLPSDVIGAPLPYPGAPATPGVPLLLENGDPVLYEDGSPVLMDV